MHFSATSLDVICADLMCAPDSGHVVLEYIDAERTVFEMMNGFGQGYAVTYQFGASRMRVLDFVEVGLL